MIRDSELVTANIAEIAKALSGAEPTLVEGFLYCLFTASEADEIAKRWALVKEIARGTPQREIARSLGLSLCKITRGSRELKKEGSSFKSMLTLAGFEVPEIIGRRRRAQTPSPPLRPLPVTPRRGPGTTGRDAEHQSSNGRRA